MDYQKIYNQLIEKARSENRKRSKEIYYENHHIIPRCMGGSNKRENLVLLTGREHFIAHKLLVEIYPENKSLVYGVWRMSYTNNRFQKKDYIVSSREFERIKVEMGLVQSKLMKGRFVGELNSMFGKTSPFKDHTHTDEVREIIRVSRTGTTASEETRKKYSEQRSGEKHHMWGKNMSEESKEKTSKTLTGHIESEETRKKKSESHKGDKNHMTSKEFSLIECPWCGKIGKDGVGMNGWHNDNCKKHPSYIHKEKEVITCPHCGFIGSNKSAMKGYHFDKCKPV